MKAKHTLLGLVLVAANANAGMFHEKVLVNTCYVHMGPCKSMGQDEQGNSIYGLEFIAEETYQYIPIRWPAKNTFVRTEYRKGEESVKVNKKDLQEGEKLRDVGMQACEDMAGDLYLINRSCEVPTNRR